MRSLASTFGFIALALLFAGVVLALLFPPYDGAAEEDASHEISDPPADEPKF